MALSMATSQVTDVAQFHCTRFVLGREQHHRVSSRLLVSHSNPRCPQMPVDRVQQRRHRQPLRRTQRELGDGPTGTDYANLDSLTARSSRRSSVSCLCIAAESYSDGGVGSPGGRKALIHLLHGRDVVVAVDVRPPRDLIELCQDRRNPET
jgi:hypothetical protein